MYISGLEKVLQPGSRLRAASQMAITPLTQPNVDHKSFLKRLLEIPAASSSKTFPRLVYIKILLA